MFLDFSLDPSPIPQYIWTIFTFVVKSDLAADIAADVAVDLPADISADL